MALEQGDLKQSLYDDLTEIQKAARRSADLTRQLLAFARRQTIAPIALDLNETISGMANMLQRLIGEDILLDWQPSSNLWTVMVDPSQIDHIFEPFFTTKGFGAGTGLGLATVYGAVRQNNGFITVNSSAEQGTTITIYLPHYKGKVMKSGTEDDSRPKQGQETILLVEDEPAILKMSAIMLKKQGYTVLSASSPGEAIRMSREHSGGIHLLMTDVIMPEMNGHSLSRNLQSLYPNLKCLFMSGYTAEVMNNHGVLEDSICFLQKPFTAQNLAKSVQKALGIMKCI